MNLRFLWLGILIVVVWNVENSESIILTTTLMTGFFGGFLIGRLTLNNFVGVLSTNGTRAFPPLQFPTLPSVNFSAIRFPPIPGLVPREEAANAAIVATIAVPAASASVPTVQNVAYATTMVPYVYAYSYPNVPNVYVYPTVAPTAAPVVRPSFQYSIPAPAPMKPLDVPLSLDNRVRDRFIRQLAIMDPLHCLPKIFCEVSADPYGATFMTNHGSIASVGGMVQPSISHQEIAAYEYQLQKLREQATSTTQAPTTTTTTTTSAPQNDEDSKSESEEDDVSTSGESESDEHSEFELRRKEEEHKMEMQALEEMVDETDDPQTYMFILRDKQRKKAQRKKFRDKMKKKKESLLLSPEGSSFRLSPHDIESEEDGFGYADILPDYNDDSISGLLNRRMSSDPVPPPPLEPPQFYPPGMPVTTEAPLTDMFAGDPFFDDFRGRSLKTEGRSSRQMFNKEELMQKYRVALMIAEKYKNPEVCGNAFQACPYRAKTILSVVNRLESGLMPFQLSSAHKKDSSHDNNNILHFKNTLLAIERLNKATLQSRLRGEPLDIEKVVQAASNPNSDLDASTSESIVNEFQQVAKKIKSVKKKKKHKKKRGKGKHKKKKDKTQEKLTPVQVYQVDSSKQVASKEVPSFKQTYQEMFKVTRLKGQKINYSTTPPPKSTTPRPVQKFSGEEEDDEKDAKESEEVINTRILSVKKNRSPIL